MRSLNRSALAAALCLAGGLTLVRPASAQTFANLVDNTMFTPAGGFYAGFRGYSLSGNTLAYRANINAGVGGTEGIFTNTFTGAGNSFQTIATNGIVYNAVPDGGNFTDFSDPTVSGHAVAFKAGYANRAGSQGIFTGDGSTLATVVTDDPGNNLAPDGGKFASFADPAISGDTVAFQAVYGNNMEKQAILTGQGGSLTTLITTGVLNSALPSSGIFLHLSQPCISGGRVGFYGDYFAGFTGVGSFTSTGGSLTTIALDNFSTAEDKGWLVNVYDKSSLSGSTMAFKALYSDSVQSLRGIFVGDGSNLDIVVTDAPGNNAVPGGGDFDGFGPPSISGSRVAFSGTYAGFTKWGLFTESKGNISSVLQVGDSLFGSTVIDLTTTANALDGDTLAFSYELADGRFGIAAATLPSISAAAPEPGSLALLAALAVPGATVIRRRRTR